MTDIKRAKNGVARRSTRVFEDDIEFRQTDEYGSDTGVLYNRKRGETEELQEKDKLAEKNIHTRRGSVSSMSATNDEIIGGLDKLKREKSREGNAGLYYISISVTNNVARGANLPGGSRQERA